MFARLKAKRGGFTLIELLVVIVVIAVLAMIVIPKFTDSGRRSKEASLHSDLAQLRSAVATFQTDTGAYPPSLATLIITDPTKIPATGLKSDGTSAPISPNDWHGPYLDSIPNDPINNGTFSYSTASGTVGKVNSQAPGNGLDNTPYSGW